MLILESLSTVVTLGVLVLKHQCIAVSTLDRYRQISIASQIGSQNRMAYNQKKLKTLVAAIVVEVTVS